LQDLLKMIRALSHRINRRHIYSFPR
jgi:hypothetical protein